MVPPFGSTGHQKDMTGKAMKNMLEPVRRAEGMPAGCCVLPVPRWTLDPAHELPGRLRPMFVLPPPQRSLLRRVAAATWSLGGAVAAGAGLMVLAQYLTTPG
jgi:hypothetical protein